MKSREMVVKVPFYAVPFRADFCIDVDGVKHLARRVEVAGEDTGDGQPLARSINPFLFERNQVVLTEDGQELGMMAWAPVTVRLDIDRRAVMVGNRDMTGTPALRNAICCDPFALPAEDLFWAARIWARVGI